MSSYLFNKIENSNICIIIQNTTMLIPDLLNILFDQANYETLTTLRCLNKRKTKYANRYSVLSHYNMKSVDFDNVCKEGLIKTVVHVVSRGEIRLGGELLCCAYGDQVLVVKYLMSVGKYDVSDGCLLYSYASDGHLGTIKYLAGIGANIHAYDDRALQWSAHNGHFGVVKFLVSIGANIHADDDYALRGSAAYGHLEIVKYLVSAGAYVHANNDHALRRSAMKGYLEIVKYLVSVGANINVDNDELFGIEMIRANFSHLRSI